MCGIAGVVSLDGASLDQATGWAMAGTLRHRGPDGSRVWVSPDGGCVLAHTRLRVIDLETGDQPMGNEDGSVQVVFNGEIYNFRELRKELENLGHRFRTRSDTEVLVHGWEAWGEELPGRLDGMFAFAVWDERRRSLFLARDRAGKKPLYLYRDSVRLAFASEIKAILALPGVDDSLCPRAIPLYLAYGYVPTPGTFYRAIRKLPPASALLLGPGGSAAERIYWRLDWTPRTFSLAEAKGMVRELMTAAVAKRLISDVPLGAFLSGGVDSTLVVGIMSQLCGEPIRTFSIGMADDPTYDESAWAARVALRFGTTHTAFRLEAQEIRILEDLLSGYDEPFGDSSALPTYIVSKLARQEVTVALTGDGGDELFAGYPRFVGVRVAEALPRWLVRFGIALGRLFPHHPDFRSFYRRFTRFFEAASLPLEERMLRWIGFFPDVLQVWLRQEWSPLLTREELLESFRAPLARVGSGSPLAKALALNFDTYLLDDLLVKADRNSMAHGLELRSPFLDTALMEFAAGLADALRIRGLRTKVLLKETFPDLLPPSVLKRKKMGFGIPLPTWLRTSWRPLVEESLLSEASHLRGWLKKEPVARMVRDHMEAKADYGHQIWALLTLELWLRRGRYTSPPTL